MTAPFGATSHPVRSQISFAAYEVSTHFINKLTVGKKYIFCFVHLNRVLIVHFVLHDVMRRRPQTTTKVIAQLRKASLRPLLHVISELVW